jgi:hypothetical protein
MKWTNKGHEFDELGAKLQKVNAVYLFGAGVHGKTAFEMYNHKITVKGFIDNDTAKQGCMFCGVPVIAPAAIKLLDGEAIVITAQPSLIDGIAEQLSNIGHADNAFPTQTFFPILDAYKFNEVCLSSVSFLPTTVCNLKCKHCLNFSPYVKEHPTRPIEQLKQDLNLLFSRIDTLLLLHISGGEPFTYPHLAELIDHIVQNCKSKLGRLEMTTNGTVVPSDKLLTAIKNADLYLAVDDYRDALPQHRSKQRELLEKLDGYKIGYQILKADSWIDLAPFESGKPHLGDEQLREHFRSCSVPWQEYRDGKLWLCNYAAYADIAGIQSSQDNEYFDLADLSADNRSELIEFRLGYSAKGYTEFCKRCLGYNNNPKSVPVAEQLK